MKTVCLGLVVAAHCGLAAAQTTEYFDEATFSLQVGGRNSIGFDLKTWGNGALLGDEYADCGVIIANMDELPINIVGNTVPGSHGSNFITEANINSPQNAISASVLVDAGTGNPDNFEFIFSEPVFAAGLYVGNLGQCIETFTTTVQFLDPAGAIIADEILHQSHAGVIYGTATSSLCGGAFPVPFDNRIFYGIVSDQLIERARVLNPTGDGDGIVIDDIQFRADLINRCDFENGVICPCFGVTP